MASGHLNIPPHLVPWQQHGVDYILSDQDLPLGLSICHAGNQQDQQNQVRQSAVASQARQAQNNTTQAKAGASRPQAWRDQAREAQTAPSQTKQASTENTEQNTSTNLFLPSEHWPKPWQELIQKTTPSPVVWTYWSLGDDLSGNASLERREFLRNLLGELAQPKGTNAFWPTALPNEPNGELVSHAQAFWSGVQMLKARAVVVMGQPATKALGLPSHLRPFMQARHNGCFVVVLRDVDLLISEPHLHANVREFLRRALAPFAKR